MPTKFTDEMVIKRGKELGVENYPEADMQSYRFRVAYASFMRDKDGVEAHEIRTGTPWDEWTSEQRRSFMMFYSNPPAPLTRPYSPGPRA